MLILLLYGGHPTQHSRKSAFNIISVITTFSSIPKKRAICFAISELGFVSLSREYMQINAEGEEDIREGGECQSADFWFERLKGRRKASCLRLHPHFECRYAGVPRLCWN